MDVCEELLSSIKDTTKLIEYISKLKDIDLERLSDDEIEIILENIFLII